MAVPVSAPGWRLSGCRDAGTSSVQSLLATLLRSPPAASKGQGMAPSPPIFRGPSCPQRVLYVSPTPEANTVAWLVTKPRCRLPNLPGAHKALEWRRPRSAPLCLPIPTGLPLRALSQRQRRAVAATSPAVTRAAEPAVPSSGGGRASSPAGAPSPPANAAGSRGRAGAVGHTARGGVAWQCMAWQCMT